MSRQLIPANPKEKREIKETFDYLNVSEFYYDTIQGEGATTGLPAVFLRLQNCIANCIWCDSKEIWRRGNPYSFEELLGMMKKNQVVDRLQSGHRLIITGGSPLLQQKKIYLFLQFFAKTFQFRPIVEIENEAMMRPDINLMYSIDQWNNSPKLSNSGLPRSIRYHPSIIKLLALHNNSWFKFVIEKKTDWEEIEQDFLIPKLIHKSQIILMPCGQTKKEILQNNQMVADLAIEKSIRYCSREHIMLWDKKIGV